MQNSRSIIHKAFGLVVISLFLLTPVFACEKRNKVEEASSTAFLAISPAILAGQVDLGTTQTAMVTQYIEFQIAANGLTSREFAALTPAQQRRVMVPGRQAALSREERRVMQLKQASIPMDVQKSIEAEAIIPNEVIAKYGIALPNSLKMALHTPEAISLMLFGNKLAAVAPNGLVLSVTTIDTL